MMAKEFGFDLFLETSAKTLAVGNDGVPGVVAALEADDVVVVGGNEVGDLALALVSPLGAHKHGGWHVSSFPRSWLSQERAHTPA